MWILFIWKLIKLPHNRWYLLLLTSTCILSFENFSMNVVYKQNFIEEITFLESETKQWCFFISTMKTASDWIFAVSKYTYSLWNGVCVDQGRNLCNTFPVIATCCIACSKKVIFFRFILKGDIYTIKWAIVLRAGFWLSKVYCLIAYILQGRNWQKFCNSQFLAAMASN